MAACDDVVFFFFFQAEDGIRDWSVTGVQTCALPICLPQIAQQAAPFEEVHGEHVLRGQRGQETETQLLIRRCAGERAEHAVPDDERSEERRVGKESRCGWSPYH